MKFIFISIIYFCSNITSSDQKSLMKSANNVFDMCQLSRNCIETVGDYKFQPIDAVNKTKGKTILKKNDETLCW